MGFNFGRAFSGGNAVKSFLGPLAGGFDGGANGGPMGPGGLRLPNFAMKKTSDFMTNDAAPQIGGPGGEQKLHSAFSGLRENASNQANAALTGNVNALQRRFAAMGTGTSGAAIKALEDAQAQSQQLNQEAQNNINFQEQNALMGRDTAQADLDFKNKVFNFDKASKLHELDLAERQQQIDAQTTEFNGRLAEFQSRPPKQGFISNALGDIL